MFRKKLQSFVVVVLFIQACSQGHKNDVTPGGGPFVVYKNIVYGTDTVQQDMDVYLPAQRDIENTPVIIMIHGGAWVTGNKTDFNGLGLDTFFTANGCALINMNYRLDGDYRYPAPVDDIGMAMDFIKQQAAAWKINPDRVCLLGRSSGSQLALLYAYSRNSDNRIKAVIDGFGPTDLIDSSMTEAAIGINLTVLLGPYEYNQKAWHDASPVFFMKGAVPTVIFQGTLDVEVNPVQSQILRDSLSARGVPCMYVSWVGAGHGWNVPDWNQWRDTTIKWVKRFL